MKCLGVNQAKLKRVLDEIEGLDVLRTDHLNGACSTTNSPQRPQDPIAGLIEVEARAGRNCLIESFHEMELQESYRLDNSAIFQVNIFREGNNIEYFYQIEQKLPFSNDFFQYLKQTFGNEANDYLAEEKDRTFSNILSRMISIFHKSIETRLNITESEVRDIMCLFLCFSLMGFEKLFPLLLDDFIEEIFLDSPEEYIYLHHARFKKCVTRIYLTEEEIQSICRRMRLETNKNLNEIYPNLKCIIKNPYFYARFCVDTKPLNPRGFSLDIRRLNKRIYDIIDLMDEKTLNIEMASFLIFCTHLRFNITITGRTDAGKTTLLNAIDTVIPAHFRKIYVRGCYRNDRTR